MIFIGYKNRNKLISFLLTAYFYKSFQRDNICFNFFSPLRSRSGEVNVLSIFIVDFVGDVIILVKESTAFLLSNVKSLLNDDVATFIPPSFSF